MDTNNRARQGSRARTQRGSDILSLVSLVQKPRVEKGPVLRMVGLVNRNVGNIRERIEM